MSGSTIDDALREAHTKGAVIAYRGEWPMVEIDVVQLDASAEDPHADACRRAFPAEETG